MSAVTLSEVTRTHTIGSSHAAASTLSASVSATAWRSRRPTSSVLRVTAQQPELEDREDEDDSEQHPGHRRGGAELEEVRERRLEQVLHDRPGGVAGSAAGEDEHLAEELERPDHVGDDDEQEHRAQQR